MFIVIINLVIGEIVKIFIVVIDDEVDVVIVWVYWWFVDYY